MAHTRGLIAPPERKNGWTLAEEAGHTGPDRIHRLLNRIEWDADEVLNVVRDYAVEHLGDPDAVRSSMTPASCFQQAMSRDRNGLQLKIVMRMLPP